MGTLSTELRNKLERAGVGARNLAEKAARAALEAMAVQHHEAYGHMNKVQKDLRNKLRAHARQLGDVQDAKGQLWRSVRVVTDHGWLLAPGGLPSLPLKKYLTECKWARCAVIKPGAQADVPTAGWFWDGTQAVACAPGAYCFKAGTEYMHGGLSLQECVTPDLVFSNPSEGKTLVVAIESVQWVGLRCRVTIKPAAPGLSAGLRGKTNDPKTGICAAKPFDSEGRAGLMVEDEDLGGTATTLVVFDASGRVLCKQVTTVGGKS